MEFQNCTFNIQPTERKLNVFREKDFTLQLYYGEGFEFPVLLRKHKNAIKMLKMMNKKMGDRVLNKRNNPNKGLKKVKYKGNFETINR